MVIQCEKCDTRFRLPDDRLKSEGVKVRCSHCKEVFTVYPPSDEPAAEAPAPEPAPEPSAPEPSPEPGGDDLDFDSAFSEDGAGFDDPPSDGGDDFELPEGDDAGSSESDDFGFDFTDSEDEGSGQSPNEFAFDEGGEWDDEGGGEAAPEEGGSSEFSFDDSTWEEESAPAEEAPTEGDVEGGGEDVGAGTKDEFSFDEEDWSDNPEPGDSGGDSGDSFGDFDSDFGIEDNAAVNETPPGPSGEGGDFKFTEISSSGMDDASISEGFSDDGSFGMDDEDLVSSVPEPPVKRQKKSSSAMLPLLLVLLLLLAGAAGFFLWQQGQLPFVDELINQIKGATSIPETSRIEVRGLDHDFVENQEAGSLFLVRGEAINRFGEKRSSLQVKGILYDGNGKALASQMVYCGNPLTNDELAGMSIADIQDAMGNQFGEALSNFEVPPGKGLPFVIVFRDVPENLVEYGVDVVGSQATQ